MKCTEKTHKLFEDQGDAENISKYVKHYDMKLEECAEKFRSDTEDLYVEEALDAQI